jgi:hypothetical protein
MSRRLKTAAHRTLSLSELMQKKPAEPTPKDRRSGDNARRT